ncbi:DNA-binding CsgD family transcriptional regulator/tetratricopeptide (TPR) repeat protein [Arthrobacter sp. CAN_A6]|uniref:helix-turn-helix transcriptional regulator n=1 Tax=Arthrobacter sp. CAN_A6 TaxID=2787721 RepID=UPI0018C976DD
MSERALQSSGSHRLIGRSSDLAAVLDGIRDYRGVLVEGESGSGKSALANAVVREIARNQEVFYITASAAVSTVPYGALAPLLTQLSAGESTSPLAVMRTVLARLQSPEQGTEPPGRAPVEPALMVLDDAHELDDSTAELVVQLVSSMQVKVLVLARPGRNSVSAMLAAALDGLLIRHSLLPLTQEQVHELCEEVLGGRLSAVSSSLIASVTGGNPLLVRALISGPTLQAHFTSSEGVWILKSQFSSNTKLEELLRRHLSGLSAGERETMEIIAFAEPIALAHLFKVGHHADVDVLAEARLIDISKAPGRLVRPRYRLYGEVLRHMVPAGRSLRLRRRLAEMPPDEPLTVEAQLRYLLWSLDCGEAIDQERLLWGAVVANNLTQASSALRLAGEIISPELLAAGRGQLARAYARLGEYKRACSILGDLADSAADFPTIKLCAFLSSQLEHRSHQTSDGTATRPGIWLAKLDTLAKSGTAADGSASGTAAIELYRELLTIQRDLRSTTQRGVAERLSEILRIAEVALDEDAILLALTLLGEALASTGRPETAVEFTTRAVRRLEKVDNHHPLSYEHVLVRHLYFLIRAGHQHEAEEELASYRRKLMGGLPDVAGAHDVSLAVLYLAKAQNANALDVLVCAIEELKVFDLLSLRPFALALGAFIAAEAGDAALAGTFVSEYKSLVHTGVPAFGLISRGYVAGAQVVLTQDGEATAQLQALKQEAKAKGWRASELEVTLLTTRLGIAESIPELRSLAEATEGAEAAALLSFADAALNRTPEGLIQVAEQATTGGFEEIGILALREGLRLAKSQGNRPAQASISRSLARWNETVAVAQPSAGVSKLTRRERDIARLVIDGKKNAEIADLLTLSVRTVEGHVYRIFEKLAINRREDLTQEYL